MKKSLLTDLGLAILRVGISLMMIFGHGLGKFQNLIAGNFEFPNPIGIGSTPSLFLAVIGEFIAPILILVGYKTRLAAIPAALTMAVAFFAVHISDPFKVQEKALLYLLVFIVIVFVGPGKFSVDKK
ncbi:DoxX family protein [Croceitalea sp. MTPC9]|uniref:DoxX family protein n=1 Tax=unclassified Croceitalea TaxID=2632280 RepID=UPI002B3CD2F8|nr:DoxX family protein [Croceitalea sp. MTPC6]GMN15630.1 DoxX family protein [Croceitalea sp. MTPC9]